jgi:hypothetical protein
LFAVPLPPASCAVPPLLTIAFCAGVGGLPNVQFADENQLPVPTVFQTSSCAYKADGPYKTMRNMIIADQKPRIIGTSQKNALSIHRALFYQISAGVAIPVFYEV